MPKTKKTIQLKNLAKYDVLIEDRSPNSAYFQITNLPTLFTGGRNSFLLGGSSLLQTGTTIQIEILDALGNTIYQNPVEKYLEGNSRLISVEVTENTAPGFATIIVMGKATTLSNGQLVPSNWRNTYNVRWSTKILVEPNLRNTSPLILKNTPTVFSDEQRFYSVGTSSFTSSSVAFTASLTPTLYSSFQIGYLIKAEAPTSFSADYLGSYITGSLLINNVSASVYVPITNILNDTTAFSTGHLITTTDGRSVDKIYLRSGSYETQIFGETARITSSANLVYSKLDINNLHIPVSYAKLRIINLNTVSGEIFKFKAYSKVATNISEYKLIADVPVSTSELLITGSIRGDLPIGEFNISPIASASWYSDRLETSSNAIYTISGSSAYYNSNSIVSPFSMSVSDDTLLRSVRAEVPTIYTNPITIIGNATESKFSGYVSSSGYFIGNKQAITLFSSSEYTFQLDAFYKKISGSVNLIGADPKVDIYLIGVNDTSIIDNNPLGQKIGTLNTVSGTETQWYQSRQFNFIPQLATSGTVGIRFVINNGFWYFSNISIKPSSDKLFAPDEAQILIPNTEYYNEYLQHKIEFFDINNNSTDVSVVSLPTFFTGSNIDLGVLS